MERDEEYIKWWVEEKWQRISEKAKALCKREFSNEIAGPRLESLYLTTMDKFRQR
jgi:hypothetical protein